MTDENDSDLEFNDDGGDLPGFYIPRLKHELQKMADDIEKLERRRKRAEYQVTRIEFLLRTKCPKAMGEGGLTLD